MSCTPSSKLEHRDLESSIPCPHQVFTPHAGPGENLLFLRLEFSYPVGHWACSLSPFWFSGKIPPAQINGTLSKEGMPSPWMHTPALHVSHDIIIITRHILYLFLCLLSPPLKKNRRTMKTGIRPGLVLYPTHRICLTTNSQSINVC